MGWLSGLLGGLLGTNSAPAETDTQKQMEKYYLGEQAFLDPYKHKAVQDISARSQQAPFNTGATLGAASRLRRPAQVMFSKDPAWTKQNNPMAIGA